MILVILKNANKESNKSTLNCINRQIGRWNVHFNGERRKQGRRDKITCCIGLGRVVDDIRTGTWKQMLASEQSPVPMNRAWLLWPISFSIAFVMWIGCRSGPPFSSNTNIPFQTSSWGLKDLLPSVLLFSPQPVTLQTPLHSVIFAFHCACCQ